MLADAGLREIVVRTYQVNTLSSWQEGLEDIVRVWPRVLSFYVRSSAFRRFFRKSLSLPKDLFDYFGYGIYIGKK